jgi:four helix bundle protein
MQLRDLEVYKVSMLIGDKIWENVTSWNSFEKSTLGKQLVRSADSIALNIAEANGRYSYKDRLLFFYYRRGSAYETRSGLQKAAQRKLISPEIHQEIDLELNRFGVLINGLIKSLRNNINNQ